MPPSQLKRLKASLREQGITGPQKSKKQKKKGLSTEQRIQRNVAIENIREAFNPFEVKTLARPSKRDVTTKKTLNGQVPKSALGRPGVTKSLGEQKRRQTLLLELQNRNKVGGIVDRRFGENDPTMTPEERSLERYKKEIERKKNASVFDLEEDDEDGLLTHGGRRLDLGGSFNLDDDFEGESLDSISEDEDSENMSRKRKRLEALEELAGNGDNVEYEPERKKSKAEILQETIMKSKLKKYERQQVKEEDDTVRQTLDDDLTDIRAALNAFQKALPPPTRDLGPSPSSAGKQGDRFHMNSERAALINGIGDADVDKTYDQQVRLLVNDKRSKPTVRTKTEEEKAEEEAERMKEQEESRLKRMKGEDEGDEEEEETPRNGQVGPIHDDDYDDAIEFGLKSRSFSRPEGVDDEDDFIIEEDLIAMDSDMDEDFTSSIGSEDSSDDELMAFDAEDDALLSGNAREEGSGPKAVSSISCPRSLDELKAAFEGLPYDGYHETIRQIRIAHDPSLRPENKEKLADLSKALVEYIAQSPEGNDPVPLSVIETAIRHIHSMARRTPDPVSQSLRSHLREMHRTKSMTPADLMVLTAIGTIFPTSDHFHQVVTPAITLMARWLGMTTPQSKQDMAVGAYLGSLCLKYQSLSQRYIPELVRFTTQALRSGRPAKEVEPHASNLIAMADLWFDETAFIDIFSPAALEALRSASLKKTQSASQRLQVLLSQAQLSRRPLELHHHRPLPIKTSVPRFEPSFDPDRDRAESARLRREYRRERKGAMRELRKDANFLARERLREKKERDGAYEEKYRRLVAEIQSEEGKERNAYEREKRIRKSKR